jgi:hypothetical protein
MFTVGQNVTLIMSCCGYSPGARGTVASVPEPEVVQVDIYNDGKGTVIEPPDPLPPLSADHFA